MVACRTGTEPQQLTLSFVLFVCEARPMRPIFGIIAIVSVPVWLCVNVESASAQTFLDRWTIIPKAHAEPATEAQDQPKQDPPLEQPPTGGGQLVVRKSAQPLDL